MYQAVRDNASTIRYVTLPREAHGYAARESTEHALYEMLAWFDKYVKNAPPRVKENKAAKYRNSVYCAAVLIELVPVGPTALAEFFVSPEVA